eukprot:13538345-Alexandrium_andersonii.AAC.1
MGATGAHAGGCWRPTARGCLGLELPSGPIWGGPIWGGPSAAPWRPSEASCEPHVLLGNGP